MEKLEMREIAVRGFINEKFGTTQGKGLFRRAVINGSVELRDPYTKYLIDLFEYANWEISAKTDMQIIQVNNLVKHGMDTEPEVLVSWIQHYDPITKVKQSVDRVCVYLPETRELYININDAAHDTVEFWTLPVVPCKNAGQNKPAFIASNVDLTKW